METEMETEEPLRGDALLVAVWNQIFEHPETHDQLHFHACSGDGWLHDFLGWANVLSGRCHTGSGYDAIKAASEALGISRYTAFWLTDNQRTQQELFLFVADRIFDYNNSEVANVVPCGELVSLKDADCWDPAGNPVRMTRITLPRKGN